MSVTREHLTRLSELMEAARLTDPALADLAGTSKQQVFKLRKGDRKMSKEWADRLAPHLGIEWTALMEGSGASVVSKPGRKAVRLPKMIELLEVGPSDSEAADLLTHPSIGPWIIPKSALPGHVSEQLAIIKVIGDAMEPDYPAGSRAVVDCAIPRPTAPGVYVLWDGAAHTLKQVEPLAGANPATVRISSINPRYAAYERPIEDVQVSGRVVGVWVWR